MPTTLMLPLSTSFLLAALAIEAAAGVIARCHTPFSLLALDTGAVAIATAASNHRGRPPGRWFDPVRFDSVRFIAHCQPETLAFVAMIPSKIPTESDLQVDAPPVRVRALTAATHAAIQPSSPSFFFSAAAAANPSAGSHRRIAIAVDLSDESAYAVKWAVQNYLRPGDAVILLHVRPTSVLYGADWGAIDLSVSADADSEEAGSEESQQKLESDFDAFMTTKAEDLAQPLVEAHIPFKIHIVKDHDMKERLCLEVERLGLSAVIMGSRGFGASRRTSKGRLGSVSDYCVRHCVCPVVVVRYPDEGGIAGGIAEGGSPVAARRSSDKDTELQPVPEEDEYHDASNQHKVNLKRQLFISLLHIHVRYGNTDTNNGTGDAIAVLSMLGVVYAS
ncbi:hypothetical protein ZIOFF_058816 [Zingiber officinale]|uniref:UspA domain-containing protein n=1 Tax=Zingiber officinale TaxID=94328 RepID=A0A8J5F8J4_ZINOF|nr:hypothetical protein ZIOFF_058816 [Zingiber officinale]